MISVVLPSCSSLASCRSTLNCLRALKRTFQSCHLLLFASAFPPLRLLVYSSMNGKESTNPSISLCPSVHKCGRGKFEKKGALFWAFPRVVFLSTFGVWIQKLQNRLLLVLLSLLEAHKALVFNRKPTSSTPVPVTNVWPQS